ncbi:MAG TPA: ABC transporter ATP-binding protein [Longimicrobiales bacterium]|jgi:iron complex transport system ATP-binding protein|nr:ABC transporter ATP-binding protein [Longimicrobiales bacterium]
MSFRTRDLRVRYVRAARPALDGVTMEVPPGTLYAVLGPNGSGKSTLMRGLMGVLRPESGEASLEGRPVAAWDRRELARTVGAVPQSESIAFPLTVREMVGMGRYPHLGALAPERPADREAVERALARCDVLHLGGRDVTTLSGGELQRVRIARALAQEPRILVLDEPTASLDIRHEMAILGLLRDQVGQGITVLLITHHLDLAGRFADRLLLLAEGRVAAEGPADEVLRADVLGHVYGWPVAVAPDPLTGTPRITPLDRPSEPPG